jgi:hypothetical protein
VANNAYNAWFSNSDLDAAKLKTCLVHQVLGALTFPGATYTGIADVNDLQALYPADTATYDCRSMANAHAGLQIPTVANDALVADVVAAMNEEAVPANVQTAITGALGPQFGDIIDETQDDAETNSAYNFLGGKNAIRTVLAGDDCDPATVGNQPCFVGRVLADATLAPFFAGAVDRDGGARLVACLQRQIAGDIAGGPDEYGNANFLVESALEDLGQCQTMLASHTGLNITDAQFEALDIHAATALTLLLGSPAEGTKAAAIIGAVVAALTGEQICRDIVESADEATACVDFDPATDPDAP